MLVYRTYIEHYIISVKRLQKDVKPLKFTFAQLKRGLSENKNSEQVSA